MASKVATGIESLDSIIYNGIPSGSLIVLMGDVGAGHSEFAYTSAAGIANLIDKRKENDKDGDMPPESQSNKVSDTIDFVVPEKINYISFVRSKEDVLNEMSLTLRKDHYESLVDNLVFEDFSDIYFKNSLVPHSWVSDETVSFDSLKDTSKEKGIMESLVTYLGKHAQNSVTIIDSLTDLVRAVSDTMQWSDFIAVFRGMQKVSKKWNCTIYAILTKDIFEHSMQAEIMNCADGVIIFEWEELGSSMRQRVMYMEKFRGVLPALEQNNIVKFEAFITTQGYAISNIKQLTGRI